MMYKQNFVAVIKCKGKILRERNGGEVYLPFGADYSILLKNKDARRVLVDVEVDGKSALNGHKLILDGNETQELKGFMRNMRKTNRFKFINKTKEIQNHRGDRIDDGLIRVVYQFERQKQEPILTYTDFPCSTRSFNTGDFIIGGEPESTFCSRSLTSSSIECATKSFAPRSDEGITVKGEKIKQHYSYGNIEALESAIHTIVLHLKGQTAGQKKVKKAITVKAKLGCETCGRKNRSTNKYCYNCGTCLY